MKKLYVVFALLLAAAMLLSACGPAATPAPAAPAAPAATEAPAAPAAPAATDVPAAPAATVAPTAAPAATAPDCTKADVFCVGVVTDVGKVDDKSFNQSAWEGIQATQASGVATWIQYIETTDSKDYAKNIATFGDAGYKMIVTVGFNLTEPTYAAAKLYPNAKFVGVDQFLFKDDKHPGLAACQPGRPGLQRRSIRLLSRRPGCDDVKGSQDRWRFRYRRCPARLALW